MNEYVFDISMAKMQPSYDSGLKIEHVFERKKKRRRKKKTIKHA